LPSTEGILSANVWTWYARLRYGETDTRAGQLHKIILTPIQEMLDRTKNASADPFLKLHTFWSTLHGLISINMMGRDDHRDELNAMVLKDFLIGFVSGMKA
jgi:hypothetical protein